MSSEAKIMLVIPRMTNGGAERVMATLANELSQRNYSVRIITLTSDESFYALSPDVEIYSANYQIEKYNIWRRNADIIMNGVKSIGFLYKQTKNWNPDTMIAFLTPTIILSVIMKIVFSKIQLIVSERNEPRRRNLPTRIITKYLYPIADYIVCQSKEVATFFPQYAQSKIKVIENPINEEALPDTLPTERRKAIVGVGRLFEQKNFSLLIDSFSEVTNLFPEYELEIYGEGPLRKVLQKKIESLGLEDKIELMGVKKNVMRYVADAELFVMSSNYEGFPNALVEAMASGLPVISTDFSTGVAREIVKKENGLLVSVNDRKALNNAIKTLLSDDKKREQMRKNNLYIRDKLSVKKVTDKWEEILT